MKARLLDCWDSFRALPAWVQGWVAGILLPANFASLFMLDTATGRAAAAALAVVVVANAAIMLLERGLGRLLAIPHLVAWIPLVAWMVVRLASGEPMESAERLLLQVLLVVNAISLAFDALDAYRWVRGERHVPRRAAMDDRA